MFTKGQAIFAFTVAFLYTLGFVFTVLQWGLKGMAIYLGATAIFGFVLIGLAMLINEINEKNDGGKKYD